MKQKNLFSRGFTLVELLVVIVLIGALAIGLFATINPVEQINRGKDSGTRNVAREFSGAVNRYYAARQTLPWVSSGGGAVTFASTLLTDATVTTVITNLVNAGELKSNFSTASTTAMGKIYFTADNTTGLINVCFRPESLSVQMDPAAIRSQSGGNPAAGVTCPGTGAVACYMCFN